MLNSKIIEMIYLYKRIWLSTLVILLSINFSQAQQQIEVQDSINVKTIRSAQAFKIVQEQKTLIQEVFYNEIGQTIRETTYQNGNPEKTIIYTFGQNGKLQFITNIAKNKTEYTRILHDSLPGIISTDSIRELFNSLPDSIYSLLHYNYIQGTNRIKQQSLFTRQNLSRIHIFNSNIYGQTLSLKIFTYNNEKKTLPDVRTLLYSYEKRRCIKISSKEFPSNLSSQTNYSYILDSRNREINKITNRDGEVSEEKTKYYDQEHKKIIEVFNKRSLIEVKTYYLDNFGNYLSIIKQNTSKDNKVEIIYEYYETK